MKRLLTLLLLCSAPAFSAWVTDVQNAHQYSMPLGTPCEDAQIDQSAPGASKVRNVQVKPGLSAPFACKEVVAQAPVPVPVPSPTPTQTSTATPTPVLEFSTDFDIPEWTQGGGLDPLPTTDAIRHHGDWLRRDGKADQITLDANRPGSAGRGFRHWRGVGTNDNGGGLKITLPKPLTEMWVRVHMRYQQGFAWRGGNPRYTKEMYWNVGGSGILIFGHQGGAWGLSYGGSVNIPSSMNWTQSQGGPIGDGKFHCYEYHVRQAGGGLVEMWFDGVQVMNKVANLGSIPWAEFALGENQHDVSVAGYTDYDDLAVSATGRIGC
jgi:hypothetical protein